MVKRNRTPESKDVRRGGRNKSSRERSSTISQNKSKPTAVIGSGALPLIRRRPLTARGAGTASVKGNRQANDLKQRWAFLTADQKSERLNELLPKFPSRRALAKAIGKSEGRIRQLLGRSDDVQEQLSSGDVESRVPVDQISSQPRTDSEASMPLKQETTIAVPSMPAEALHDSTKGKTAHDNGPTVQEVMDAQGEPRARKEVGDADSSGVGEQRGETARAATAPDYAMKDVRAGGELVFAWIRANIKSCDWDDAIQDLKRSAYWLSRNAYHQEVRQEGDIPAGFTPEQVIKYCLTSSLEKELESNPREARRKWFACWTSVLLPDPGDRRDAVEFAGKLLSCVAGVGII